MQDKRGHSHTINNLCCEGETGGESVREAGKHVDSTADGEKERERERERERKRERGKRKKESETDRMRRCLFFTRRLIDKTLEKLREIPEKKYGINYAVFQVALSHHCNKEISNDV